MHRTAPRGAKRPDGGGRIRRADNLAGVIDAADDAVVPSGPYAETVDPAAAHYEPTVRGTGNGAARGFAVVVQAADDDAVAFF